MKPAFRDWVMFYSVIKGLAVSMGCLLFCCSSLICWTLISKPAIFVSTLWQCKWQKTTARKNTTTNNRTPTATAIINVFWWTSFSRSFSLTASLSNSLSLAISMSAYFLTSVSCSFSMTVRLLTSFSYSFAAADCLATSFSRPFYISACLWISLSLANSMSFYF